MISINENKLQEVITGYKKYFPEKIQYEIYKWKAVKRFQDTWDINATDFGKMFEKATALHGNLLSSRHHFPRGVIIDFCKSDPETVRNMFRFLFDESKPLFNRINAFISQSKNLLDKYLPGKVHFQDINSISIYLWSMYPEKYYIYKFSELEATAETLDSNYVFTKGGGAVSYEMAIELFNNIRTAIQKDKEIRSMLDSVLTDDCYRDNNLNCMVIDIHYYISRYFNKQGTIINTPMPNVKEPMQTGDKHYWWLVANPKIWSIMGMKIGEEQDYSLYNENGHKRNIFQNFLNAKAGDIVLGYESSPTKQVVCLLEISKENDGKSLYFKMTEKLPTPIDFSTLKNTPGLDNMEYMRNQQGSFFKVTPDEFDIIMDLVRGDNPLPKKESNEAYNKSRFLDEVYVSYDDYDQLESLLLRKKNLILQGAPGVGKTFAAKRLAYALMGEIDDSRVMQVQFHQNYCYEDFVMGYKPNEDGGFELKNGIFYKFCKRAAADREHKYFFIIDEINRGNLSKIFGELLMLIENDYRDKPIQMSYRDELFSVPENLYLIGMMNTADRSLAMIDYALRRRFSFFEMKPGYENPAFMEYSKKLMDPKLNKLVNAIIELNKVIEGDDSLGSGFCIGHSYLCNLGAHYNLENIVEYDIIPMLREYWFDNNDRFNQEAQKLRNALK